MGSIRACVAEGYCGRRHTHGQWRCPCAPANPCACFGSVQVAGEARVVPWRAAILFAERCPRAQSTTSGLASGVEPSLASLEQCCHAFPYLREPYTGRRRRLGRTAISTRMRKAAVGARHHHHWGVASRHPHVGRLLGQSRCASWPAGTCAVHPEIGPFFPHFSGTPPCVRAWATTPCMFRNLLQQGAVCARACHRHSSRQ